MQQSPGIHWISSLRHPAEELEDDEELADELELRLLDEDEDLELDELEPEELTLDELDRDELLDRLEEEDTDEELLEELLDELREDDRDEDLDEETDDELTEELEREEEEIGTESIMAGSEGSADEYNWFKNTHATIPATTRALMRLLFLDSTNTRSSATLRRRSITCTLATSKPH